MKKIIAIVLTLLLLFSLTACGQAALTHKLRWDIAEGEELTYNITLFSKRVDSENKVVYDYALLDPTIVDQIMPITATGTYKTKIAPTTDPAVTTLTTTLKVVEEYDKSDISSETLTLLKANDLIESETSNTIKVVTTIDTTAKFNYYTYQTSHSFRSVKGIYLGKERQFVNNYTVECIYTDNAKNDTCQMDIVDNIGDYDYSNNVTLNTTAEYFDNEVLLFAIRSYDVGSMSNAMAMSVMDAISTHNAINLSVQSTSNNVYLSDKYTMKLTQVGVGNGTSIGYMYLSFCTGEELYFDGAPRVTNRLMKMQQGYLVYTLCDEDIALVQSNISK